LGELVRRAGAKFTFVFDFGDRWTHTIRVEKIEPALPNAIYPRCIAGEGADPLEDCGGPWNWMEVFAAVTQPEQPRNETIRHIVADWVGEGWDLRRFSVEGSQQEIQEDFLLARGDQPSPRVIPGKPPKQSQ
jgi:pRiA4b ORF-3-like protein